MWGNGKRRRDLKKPLDQGALTYGYFFVLVEEF